MLSLKTVFATLKSVCQAQFLRTEDASEAGYLLHRFRLCDDLDIIVRFNLETNLVDEVESVDELDWDNDRVIFGCFLASEADLIAFVLKAIKRQLRSRLFPEGK